MLAFFGNSIVIAHRALQIDLRACSISAMLGAASLTAAHTLRCECGSLPR